MLTKIQLKKKINILYCRMQIVNCCFILLCVHSTHEWRILSVRKNNTFLNIWKIISTLKKKNVL